MCAPTIQRILFELYSPQSSKVFLWTMEWFSTQSYRPRLAYLSCSLHWGCSQSPTQGPVALSSIHVPRTEKLEYPTSSSTYPLPTSWHAYVGGGGGGVPDLCEEDVSNNLFPAPRYQTSPSSSNIIRLCASLTWLQEDLLCLFNHLSGGFW